MYEMGINNNGRQQSGRRIVVNGVLLTYKQTALFEKSMAESDTFRTRFMALATDAK